MNIARLPFSLLIFMGLLLPVLSPGQSPARLRCAEVQGNGDVMLHWVPEVFGVDQAYSYTLYHSSSINGPYTQLDSIIVLTQDTYLHSGAGANIAPQYYYMFVYRLSGISLPSDTLGTMLLQASTSDFEIVDLNWTPLHDPLASYMHPWYLVFREYPPGNWAVVDSTQGLSATHHFWECNENLDTIRFKIGVKVEDVLVQCTSFSSVAKGVLQNQTNRFPPVIDSVSIDANGHVVIGWQPAVEPDATGYKIFQVTTSNDSIDYVDGRFNTTYTHMASDPCRGPVSYILLTIDSCGNESLFPYDPVTFNDKPHNTLYLEEIAYDPCTMSNGLAWNSYRNFEPPLEGYRVYASLNGGPFGLLETLPATDTVFIHENLAGNTNYAYYIRAFSEGSAKTSTSCVQQVRTYDSPKPEFMYIRHVSVEDNERVNVIFYTDTSAHVQHYRVLRSDSPAGPFEEVGQMEDQGQEFVVFDDPTAEVNAISYYYQVEVVDSCGVASVIANTSRTIYLEVEALDNYQNVLTWNAYESWEGLVAGYRVYRRLNEGPSLDMLYEGGAAELTFTDDVSDLTGNTSRMSYLVEAYEGPGVNWDFRESSFSNEVVAEQESRIYMPNAILPRGLNNILKPVSVFVGGPGYEFLVYNRWGQVIFRTTDPNQGWDGTCNGEYVDSGVYVYLILYRNAKDQPRVQKGNVAVIY